MNTCGDCKHIKADLFSKFVCTKTGRPAGLLQSKDCFTPKDTKMETEYIKKTDDTFTTDTEKVKTKVCKRCGKELPIHEFARNARAADGHQVYCRECQKAAMMRTRRAKVEKDKERATYGLASFSTEDIVNELRRRGLTGYLKQVVEISV